MIESKSFEAPRTLRSERIDVDLCFVGGGLAGVCGAITAAREGLRVALVQDRPLLGGNSSSEVRLWALGASAHNHNNNRWAREGGVIDEILVENMYRNPEGNPLIYDTILLEWVKRESNVLLLLNTVATKIESVSDAAGVTIRSVEAFNSQSETRFEVNASMFVDSSGDGILAYLAGLPYRIGAESSEEFGEGFAPDPEQYGELLGHSIFFMTKDAGRPVSYASPAYALHNAQDHIPRIKSFTANDQGCEFWWIEYGGRLDTIHDTETIKWELWRIVLGVWDYIKNSGEYPEARNLTLEWLGHIPGKRESRRFEGLSMLTQHDIVDQRNHDDAVSFGGWSLDLHPADGVYTARPGCDQYHSKGVYQIPYSTMVSPRATNLFLAGRIISCTHVAFGSTRVMCTCAHNAQAVAMAAAIALRDAVTPTTIAQKPFIDELKRRLVRRGQYIPNYQLTGDGNLVKRARLSASSAIDLLRDLSPEGATEAWEKRGCSASGFAENSSFSESVMRGYGERPQDNEKSERQDDRFVAQADGSVPSYGEYQRSPEAEQRPNLFRCTTGLCPLTQSVSQMIPVISGLLPTVRFRATVLADTEVRVELRICSKRQNYTPDRLIGESTLDLTAGDERAISIRPAQFGDGQIEENAYLYVVFRSNEFVALRTRPEWVSGIFSLRHSGYQQPPLEWGIDGFEIWTPPRRPQGHLIAFELDYSDAGHGRNIERFEEPFAVDQIRNGLQRPTTWPNAWVASPLDENPWVRVDWNTTTEIRRVEVVFDTDTNHPMETVIRGHTERAIPMCAKSFVLTDGNGQKLAEERDWHHTVWSVDFEPSLHLRSLALEMIQTHGDAPAAVYDFRVYS